MLTFNLYSAIIQTGDYMSSFLFAFEIIGTIAFAVSGAVKAIKYKMDMLGVCILGIVTGVGGGVMRDTIIGNTPALAIRDPLFGIIALVTSLAVFLIVFFTKSKTEGGKRYSAIMFLADTLGLAVFANTALTIARGANIDNPIALIVLGTLTGVGGGVIRDMFCGDVPYVFKKHIYALAAAAGSLVNILAHMLLPENISVILGVGTVILIRILAAHFKWNLPKIEYFK